jgi:hypothetical protein
MTKVNYWLTKFKESAISTAPIAVLIFAFFFVQKYGLQGSFKEQYYISNNELWAFLISVASIILGMGLFNVGTEQSMTEIGELIGGSLVKKKNFFFVIAMTFILGVLVTIAEPDLAVLSGQIGVDEQVIVWTIGVGVGAFLVIGVLRVFFKMNLNTLFLAFYGLAFTLVYLIDPRFLPICFDSGGVTTGPVTVPFLLGFGLGLAATHGSKNSEDAFGLTALCSVGPVLAVIIIAGIMKASGKALPDAYSISLASDSLGEMIAHGLLHSLKNVALSVVPILLFFIVYELLFIRLSWRMVLRVTLGMVYTYFGLVLFLSAVEYGFMPIAQKVGMSFGSDPKFFPFALILGSLFGVFGVLAEPAVHVLVQQIQDITDGTIKKGTVLAILAASIGAAVALHLVRSYFEFDIMYYLIPGYILAFVLSFCVPPIYTAMAFDSGGVASGPMTSTFVLPFCIGFAVSRGSDPYLYGFGLVAMVAMMPLIVLQALGLVSGIKKANALAKARKRIVEEDDAQVIHFMEEEAEA